MVSLRVGLTGGIGCGKSLVARAFARRGVPVIDADEIAHDLVQPGRSAVAGIVDAFGTGVLRDGKLDRPLLRDLVFRDDAKRRQLEAILHPRVYAAMEAQVQQLPDPYCVLSIPLLLETGRRDFVDRILVVDCPAELQIERVKRRDASSEAAVWRIMARQASRQERLAAADDVIENEREPDLLDERVQVLHHAYLRLAASRRETTRAS